MQKILHIIDSLASGGAERLLVDVICGLPQYEHHLVVLNGPETLRDELPANCRFTNLHRKSNREIQRHARAIKNYIRVHHIDLVHAHLFFSSVISRLATPRSIPLLNSIHSISSLDNYTKNKLAFYLEKLTYRKHHHIIAVSKEALTDFDKWIGIRGPSTVLHNFIKDEFFLDVSRQKPSLQSMRLVAVGNLKYPKNYPFLIEAFKSMPSNVSLDIYGSGEMQQSLQEEIDKHQLRICLQGSRKNIYEVLPSYDAFVMSSLFEGQPLSLLEAIACGLPAILSDIPVLKEVTGPYAIYFDVNCPLDFVGKIRDILAGKINLQAHTVPALEKISSFARKEVYFSRLVSLYESKFTYAKKCRND